MARLVDFWVRTRRDARGCWLWVGSKDTRGYGIVSVDGRLQKAHRVAWMQARGAIPGGLMVLHGCDVKACCNVEHLHLGTHADNMREAFERGLMPNLGQLDARRAEAIRLDARSCRVVAREYGIGPSQVSRIRRGLAWAR